MRILFFGLPGSGKTTLADTLASLLPQTHRINADEVRKTFTDWDFTPEGRIRQAKRMHDLSVWVHEKCAAEYVISDFVAPTTLHRTEFNADFAVWMDTIPEGRFADTNALWEPPERYEYDIRILNKNAEVEVQRIIQHLNS